MDIRTALRTISSLLPPLNLPVRLVHLPHLLLVHLVYLLLRQRHRFHQVLEEDIVYIVCRVSLFVSWLTGSDFDDTGGSASSSLRCGRRDVDDHK
jgi:hypothetical protein